MPSNKLWGRLRIVQRDVPLHGRGFGFNTHHPGRVALDQQRRDGSHLNYDISARRPRHRLRGGGGIGGGAGEEENQKVTPRDARTTSAYPRSSSTISASPVICWALETTANASAPTTHKLLQHRAGNVWRGHDGLRAESNSPGAIPRTLGIFFYSLASPRWGTRTDGSASARRGGGSLRQGLYDSGNRGWERSTVR